MNRQLTSTFLALALALPLALPASAQGTASYQNGGVGASEQETIKASAADYSLQLLFSQGANGEYISEVKLDITDAKGASVLALPSAGPMTNVKLPPGKYKLQATYQGQSRQQDVVISAAKPTRLSLNWAASGK